MHALWPERLRCERGGQSRVDSTRNTDDDVFEPVLADVVAQPENEGVAHLLQVVVQRREGRRVRLLEVDDEKGLLEAGRPRDHAAVALDEERVPVEDELVLAADHVAEGDTHAALSGSRGEDRLALLRPPDVVRGCREVDDELGTCRGQSGGRWPGNPHVLADRDADPRARHVDDRKLGAGGEVALLVEHAVVRQVPLPGPACDLAVGADRARVVENVLEKWHADQRDDASRFRSDQLDRLSSRADEARPEEKILGRIAGHRELRKDNEVCAGRPGLLDATEDRLAVSREVADNRIYLRESETHGFTTQSLKHRGEVTLDGHSGACPRCDSGAPEPDRVPVVFENLVDPPAQRLRRVVLGMEVAPGECVEIA